MSEKNTDIELSVDELNKVSGSGGRKNISNGISAGAECDPDFISKGNVSFEKKGRKGKNPSVIFPGNDEYDQG